ncbi:hypothetical protein [Burkholderia sp. TSV86]|uniref:hypothetical protein n=1 Tax=Burkholderia sp. TSV86 TaxID=1385594 RepID=UPI000A518A56|nr:hypothetical protein [Burkholderia sp. TSV86]
MTPRLGKWKEEEWQADTGGKRDETGSAAIRAPGGREPGHSADHSDDAEKGAN